MKYWITSTRIISSIGPSSQYFREENHPLAVFAGADCFMFWAAFHLASVAFTRSLLSCFTSFCENDGRASEIGMPEWGNIVRGTHDVQREKSERTNYRDFLSFAQRTRSAEEGVGVNYSEANWSSGIQLYYKQRKPTANNSILSCLEYVVLVE